MALWRGLLVSGWYAALSGNVKHPHAEPSLKSTHCGVLWLSDWSRSHTRSRQSWDKNMSKDPQSLSRNHPRQTCSYVPIPNTLLCPPQFGASSCRKVHEQSTVFMGGRAALQSCSSSQCQLIWQPALLRWLPWPNMCCNVPKMGTDLLLKQSLACGRLGQLSYVADDAEWHGCAYV